MAAFPSRDLEAFMAHQAKIAADDAVIRRSIVADGTLVGSVSSWAAEGERNVGYWIGKQHWGRGIATAALAAFVEIDRHRPLCAYAAVHNVGSQRVLLKCGFTIVRQQHVDGVDEFVLTLERA